MLSIFFYLCLSSRRTLFFILLSSHHIVCPVQSDCDQLHIILVEIPYDKTHHHKLTGDIYLLLLKYQFIALLMVRDRWFVLSMIELGYVLSKLTILYFS